MHPYTYAVINDNWQGIRVPEWLHQFCRNISAREVGRQRPLGMPAQRSGGSIVAIFDADTPGTLVTTTMLPVLLFDET